MKRICKQICFGAGFLLIFVAAGISDNNGAWASFLPFVVGGLFLWAAAFLLDAFETSQQERIQSLEERRTGMDNKDVLIQINYDADYRSGGVYAAVNYTNQALARIMGKLTLHSRLSVRELAVLQHIANKYECPELVEQLLDHLPDEQELVAWNALIRRARQDNPPFFSNIFEVLEEGQSRTLLEAYGYLQPLPSHGKKRCAAETPPQIHYQLRRNGGFHAAWSREDRILLQVAQDFRRGGVHNPDGRCPYFCPSTSERDGIYIEEMLVTGTRSGIMAA